MLTICACGNTSNRSVCNLFVASGAYEVVKQLTSSVSDNISVNSASSGVLARQISAGAGADIYISANREWVDYLIKSGYTKHSNTEVLFNDKLAIVTHADNDFKIHDFYNWSDDKREGYIVVGNPEYVPAGRYAFQYLKSTNILTNTKEKVLFAKNVSDVLKYVEIKECDYGIAYLSMAKQSKNIRVLEVIPEDKHSKIEFIICKLNNKQETNRIYNLLLSDSSRNKIKEYNLISAKGN
jgi:molybdate transport system substrate-binding protein